MSSTIAPVGTPTYFPFSSVSRAKCAILATSYPLYAVSGPQHSRIYEHTLPLFQLQAARNLSHFTSLGSRSTKSFAFHRIDLTHSQTCYPNVEAIDYTSLRDLSRRRTGTRRTS